MVSTGFGLELHANRDERHKDIRENILMLSYKHRESHYVFRITSYIYSMLCFYTTIIPDVRRARFEARERLVAAGGLEPPT